MSASSTALRREMIGRATRIAREKAIQRREQRAQIIEAAYDHLADSVLEWLQQNGDSQGRVPPEVLGAFDAFLEIALRRVQLELAQGLTEGLTEAAALGASVFLTSADRVVSNTVLHLQDFIAADGLQLSDRLWRVGVATKTRVAEAIRNAVLRGSSAWQAAQELVAQGHAVPTETALAARAAQAPVLGAEVKAELTTRSGNPMRNALRVLRTEVNRAFTESFVAASLEHPEVAAVKFNLSPLHPRTDICDLYAHANLHGLGPGVYPQGAHPYPAHPETLSYLTVVFVDEITDADRAGRESMFDWLNDQAPAAQDAVLGQHKAAAFRDGKLQESELQANWRDVKNRIGEPDT